MFTQDRPHLWSTCMDRDARRHGPAGVRYDLHAEPQGGEIDADQVQDGGKSNIAQILCQLSDSSCSGHWDI